MGSCKHFKKPERLGKIDSPLNDKLNQVKWGEFVIEEYFEKVKVQTLTYKAADLPSEPTGEYVLPALTAGIQNQGLNNYVPVGNATILQNVISISANGANTGATFFQSHKFTVLQDAYAIKWRGGNELTDHQYLFMAAAISKTIYGNYEWTNKAGWERIKTKSIKLPVTADGTIDFGFIDEFVAELETQRVAELEAYLNACNLNDYQLTKDEEEAINNFDSIKWEIFNIIDVFDVKNTSNLLSSEIIENSGNIPYLCASSLNNSVSTYISHDQSYLEKGNCIFIGGKTCEISYQEKDFFSNDSHNLALYLKKSNPTKLTQLYLVTCLFKSLNYKYSWGNSISKAKIKNDIVYLPTKNNVPNYEDMQLLIKAVQKLVIKDVVDFADKKINATKQVIK